MIDKGKNEVEGKSKNNTGVSNEIMLADYTNIYQFGFNPHLPISIIECKRGRYFKLITFAKWWKDETGIKNISLIFGDDNDRQVWQECSFNANSSIKI